MNLSMLSKLGYSCKIYAKKRSMKRLLTNWFVRHSTTNMLKSKVM